MEDRIRVLRVIEYEGPRSAVEKQVSNSIHGTRYPGNGCVIRAATIGTYPEILTLATSEPREEEAHDSQSNKD